MHINAFNELIPNGDIEKKVIGVFSKYSRSYLREVAKAWRIPQGQNKTDTIKNICESEHFITLLSLMVRRPTPIHVIA